MRIYLLAVLVPAAMFAQSGFAAAQRAVGDPVNGKAVFAFGNTSCTNCHGLEAQGGWGPDLAGKGMSVARATLAIRAPIWRMPAFAPSQLSDKEILDMVTYWNSLPPAPAIGKWRTEAPLNAPLGQHLAVNIIGCAQCHGATLTTPRHGAAEVNGDFEWFKNTVYRHSVAQPEKWRQLDLLAAPEPPARRPRVRMGNYSERRLPEATLREIWDWMNDLGLLVPVRARLTGGPASATGTTYVLDVSSESMPQKGLTAEDVTVSLIVPAGTTVTAASGEGYQGVKQETTGEVAVWRLPRLAPRDHYTFSITLAGSPQGDAVLRGTVGWAKPSATSDALVNFALPRPGGRGRGAGE
jgi:mono/diheme cytochrome c family protein